MSVWIARTHGLIHTLLTTGSVHPSHSRLHGVVHRFFVPRRITVSHLRDTVRSRVREMDPLGFEPRASSLQRRHSTTELWALPLALAVQRCSVGHRRRASIDAKGGSGTTPRSRSVGGDPAADSPTATLLRLKPPCGAQIRPRNSASSGPHSGALTGGVCKEQGRIHRALVTRDYYRIQLHVGEFQPTIRTTTKFRRLAPPLGVASHCLGHCSPRVAQLIRGILTYRCPFLPPSWRRQSP